MRLIDADALTADILALPDCQNGYSETYDKACIIGMIDEQPSVDAVPVIRCRDCKNFHDEWGNKWCYITKWRTNEDRFCSSAKKIED